MLEEALKTLVQNKLISEELRSELETAWNTKITENRKLVTQELREEFATRYEHDKSLMVESVDKLLSEQLQEEIAQFVEDRTQLAEQKAKYAIKMKNDANLMKEFISRQLAQEVKDLHEDRQTLVSQFSKLEEFVVEALAGEIAEFYTDKQDLAETKVKLVREGKQALAMLKEQFIKRASTLVESTVEKTLNKEISMLKEDIELARKNDFGRKLFEAFAGEYQTSYLNEKAESTKLLKTIETQKQEVMEAKAVVAKSLKVIEAKDMEVQRLTESKQRQEIMSEMMAPLSKDHKAIMTELLESVQTSKLKGSFEKYLPAVINGNSAPKKSSLMEATEVTGNKPNVDTSINRQTDANIVDIRRLAGIKH